MEISTTECRFKSSVLQGFLRRFRPISKGNASLFYQTRFVCQWCGTDDGDNLEGDRFSISARLEPNPTCESVDLAAEQARRMGADCVIGLGGGAPGRSENCFLPDHQRRQYL